MPDKTSDVARPSFKPGFWFYSILVFSMLAAAWVMSQAWNFDLLKAVTILILILAIPSLIGFTFKKLLEIPWKGIGIAIVLLVGWWLWFNGFVLLGKLWDLMAADTTLISPAAAVLFVLGLGILIERLIRDDGNKDRSTAFWISVPMLFIAFVRSATVVWLIGTLEGILMMTILIIVHRWMKKDEAEHGKYIIVSMMYTNNHKKIVVNGFLALIVLSILLFLVSYYGIDWWTKLIVSYSYISGLWYTHGLWKRFHYKDEEI